MVTYDDSIMTQSVLRYTNGVVNMHGNQNFLTALCLCADQPITYEEVLGRTLLLLWINKAI